MSKVAIVEIITTGLNFNIDRIIHISVIRVENYSITDAFETYLYPEHSIDPQYAIVRGISDMDLKSKPKFFEIAKDLLMILQDSRIVSVDPRFTYSFLKKEFKNLGFDFNQSYISADQMLHLQEVKMDMGIGKARILAEALVKQTLQNDFLPSGKKTDHSPMHYVEQRLKDIPNVCGVYMLVNSAGQIIYTGKALKVRNRIRQHFRELSVKGFNIHRKVADIKYIETKSELLALLLELHLILDKRPELNRALRNTSFKYELLYKKSESQSSLHLAPEGSLDGIVLKKFKNWKQARLNILEISMKHKLRQGDIHIHNQPNVLLNARAPESINGSSTDIEAVADEINPFYIGRFIIRDKDYPQYYVLTRDAKILGFGYSTEENQDFDQLYDQMQYQFDHTLAMNITLQFYTKNKLKIYKV